mgnify:CR=1
MFEPAASSNRQAGGGFCKSDLVRCVLTNRVGIVTNVYHDIRISDMHRILQIDVTFPEGTEEIFSPRELVLVASVNEPLE